MNNSNCFRDLFESIPDFIKILLIIFLFQNDKDLLREIGFSEHDFDRLNLDFKNTLKKQHEEYLDYVKNEEKSNVERFLNK